MWRLPSPSLALLLTGFAATEALPADPALPDPLQQIIDDAPRGTVKQMPPWASKIYPETTRDWSLYIPAQYKAEQPAAVMVFQDGRDFLHPRGVWRVARAFDTLIARGEMPVTIGIFLNPGHNVPGAELPTLTSASNRNAEYDSVCHRYAQFLVEEILPEVAKTYRISDDPEMRAICGMSGGAACAFTVAWHRPDAFRKVLAATGAFVNVAGAHGYPALIRKTEPKPLRVFLEDNFNDIETRAGSFPIANQQMHAALKYMGYNCRLEMGDTGHSAKHAGSILSEALKWLWRKDAAPAPKVAAKADIGGDMPLHRILIPGEDWQVVSEGLGFADGACADGEGNFYFSDMKAPAIFKVAPDGTRTKLIDEPASGLKFGPDGRLYACQGAKKRLIAIDLANSAIEVIAADVEPNDLAVSRRGQIYFTETGKKQVTVVDLATKEQRIADTGITGPNGITLSPDEGTLAVSDYAGEHVWAFRVNANGGTLSAKAPYMTLRRPLATGGKFVMHAPVAYVPASGGDGATSDSDGRYYVTSSLGVQIFDPTGRLCGVLAKPRPAKPLTSCVLAGANGGYLYVTNGDSIFRRKVQASSHVGRTAAVGISSRQP